MRRITSGCTGRAASGTEKVTFWLGDRMLARYVVGTSSLTLDAIWRYFGGRNLSVVPDRVGSNVADGKRYYPYGEEVAVSTGEDYKFGTYWRDGTGFDYADQRYYSGSVGRFLAVDRFWGSAVVGNPTSWNRYTYVNADPVNFNDPTGLDCASTPFIFNGQYQGTVGSIMGQESDVSLLATAMYTESGHGRGVDVAAEEYAIGAVIMNRWQFVNSNWYLSSSAGGPSLNVSSWGTPGDSISSIIKNPPQFAIYIRGADGNVSLSASAQRNLYGALSSNVGSSACDDLAFAITLAFGMWRSRKDGDPLYLYDGLILTGFNSFSPAHPSAPYEQRAGSFGDANTFYGVPDANVSETPIRPPRRTIRPPRPPRPVIR